MPTPFLSSSKFVVTIDQKALLQEISTGKNGKVTGREIRKYVLPIMEEARDDLVKDFYNHPVTREIKAGPTASNSSGTLGGYGNLFSFIGFESGDDPIVAIGKILQRRLNVKVRSINNGRFRITMFNLPDTEEIFGASPIPWATSMSWADGIERGISNLGSFLYREKGIRGSSKGSRSRSGTGIQVENTLRQNSFSTTPYVSKMINEFLKKVVKF